MHILSTIEWKIFPIEMTTTTMEKTLIDLIGKSFSWKIEHFLIALCVYVS